MQGITGYRKEEGLKKIILTGIAAAAICISIHCQTDDRERFVQVSGIITDASFRPMAGVAVISKKLRRGSISEPTGIYSITSSPGDTIFFRALGYKRYHSVIPLDFSGRNAKVDIALEMDTISIEEISIMPWKTYNEFIRDMTREKPADPLIENMNENIASIYVAVQNQTGITVSPEAGFRYVMEQNFSAQATKGQYPVNNLLNPFAWAKFINGLKNGMLKNQKSIRPSNAKVRKKLKNPDKD
ncbi:MAG: carboxypeptidase-like regulatory domain-containing protein [Bacteroidales bacterium]|nr:carboxypeptidase-like regulatory domain-containing protein [Bacteroidales bacterium]